MSNRCGFVALLGRPNVGKSTLLNRLIGQKLAITSHKPQTTRHRIMGVKTRPDGQLLYLDMPGLHQRGDKALNRYLNRTARATVGESDLVVLLVEALVWNREDEAGLKQALESGRPVILAVNKVDLVEPKERLLPFLREVGAKADFATVVPVSAADGANCESLENELLARLPEGDNLLPEDQITDRPERFFVAELIREQLTKRYHEELPYAVTVEIEQYQVEGRLIRIAALIWVERENQKAILIGKKGEALKQTGRAARLALQEFLESKVHLELWVKVRGDWSKSELDLAGLGYQDEGKS